MPTGHPKDQEIDRVIDLSDEEIKGYKDSLGLSDRIRRDIWKLIKYIFEDLNEDETILWDEIRAKHKIGPLSNMRICWTRKILTVYKEIKE